MGSICLYGGVSKYEQQNALRSQNPPIRIVVGTPGRVKDLASTEGSGLDLSKVSFLVLDEADRMLDKGFEPDIRFIIGLCQSREQGRKTSMFSATWPPAVRGLAETFMNNPVRVTVGSDELSANRRVEQTVEVLDDGRAKERKLDVFLKNVGAGPRGSKPKDKILIFALYKKVSSFFRFLFCIICSGERTHVDFMLDSTGSCSRRRQPSSSGLLCLCHSW